MSKLTKILALTTLLTFILPIITFAAYIGNKNSYKFHSQSCRAAAKIKATNKKYFETREEAVAHGMKPCGICRP